MVGSDNPILPILDRRAPILERIRDGKGEDNVAQNLGELVGRVIKTDSEIEVEQTRQDFADGFTNSLADELGVQAPDINTEFVNGLANDLTNVTEDDVLNPQIIEELDIQATDKETTDDSGHEQSGEESTSVTGLFEESEEGEGEEEGGEEETDT